MPRENSQVTSQNMHEFLRIPRNMTIGYNINGGWAIFMRKEHFTWEIVHVEPTRNKALEWIKDQIRLTAIKNYTTEEKVVETLNNYAWEEWK